MTRKKAKYKIISVCKKCGLPNKIEIYETMNIIEVPTTCICFRKRGK